MQAPEDLRLDMSVLRIRELRLITEMSGRPFSEVMKALQVGEMDVNVAAALALVALRRVDPNATPEDAEEVDLLGLMKGSSGENEAPKV